MSDERRKSTCELIADPSQPADLIRLHAQTSLAEVACMERIIDLDYDGFAADLDIINGVDDEAT